MKKTIRFSFFILLILSCYSNLTIADHASDSSHHSALPQVVKIKDLRETSQAAQSKSLPILIMFGTDECPYCKLLKEEFLIPMLISGDYTDKIIIREAHISPRAEIIDFSGKKISISEFSNRYNIHLFPTMIFIDATGQVLVENIRGITTPSLFGGTLDDTIDKALLLVRKKL